MRKLKPTKTIICANISEKDDRASKLIVFRKFEVYLKNSGDEVRSSVGLRPRAWAASLFVMMSSSVFLSCRGSLVTR